jgi:hypothetical protein
MKVERLVGSIIGMAAVDPANGMLYMFLSTQEEVRNIVNQSELI